MVKKLFLILALWLSFAVPALPQLLCVYPGLCSPSSTGGPPPTAWTPLDITSATLVAWYRINDPNGVVSQGADVYNGSATTNWTDRSGNGRTLIKNGSPAWNATGLASGYPTVDTTAGGLGGSAFFRIASGFGLTSAKLGVFHIGAVGTNFGGERIISAAPSGGSDDTTGSIPLLITDGTTITQYQSGFGTQNQTYTAAAAVLLEIYQSASAVQFAKNAVPGASPVSGSPAISYDTFALSAQSNNAANVGGSKTAELVVIDGVLSSGDLSKLEGYLACNNGQQALLPSGHPYKTACP